MDICGGHEITVAQRTRGVEIYPGDSTRCQLADPELQTGPGLGTASATHRTTRSLRWTYGAGTVCPVPGGKNSRPCVLEKRPDLSDRAPGFHQPQRAGDQ